MKSVVFEVWGEVIAPMDLVQPREPKGEGPGATSVVLIGMVNMIPAQESLKKESIYVWTNWRYLPVEVTHLKWW